jgi:hypothetical protein
MTTPNRPHRASPPQHRARGGRPVVPFQQETWTPPGWLVLTLLAAGLLLVALAATLTR